MMKQYPHAALLLLFSLCLSSLTGCIYDDLSVCTSPDNLVLEFQLQAVTAGAGSGEKLNSVDVLLFDGQGLFVDRQRLEREDLEAFRGARFSVFAGDYLVSAWANIASGSRLSELVPGESRIEEGFVEMLAGGDSLYYAPAKSNAYAGEAALRAGSKAADPYALHRVHVPYGGVQVVRELPFTRAYRSVNIYIKGAENLRPAAPAGSSTQPEPLSVEAVNLGTRYDLLFNTVASERRNDTRLCTSTLTPQGRMQAARFFSAYGPVTNDIAFTLGNLPEEIPPLSILLADYLRVNGLTNFDDLDILVEFFGNIPGTSTGVQVSITAPDWSSRPVQPEY